MNPQSTLRRVGFSTALGLAVLAQAQTTPPPASKPAVDDDTIQLSAFEVRADGTSGYLTAESTSGTRYAAPVMEIPFAINTVSSEFLESFLVFDFSGQDALNYVSGSSPTNTGSTGDISLRGIRGFAVYKNGIREGGMYGPASLDRVEVLKGANAAIYGQSEPSGMTNRITKEGRPNAFQSVKLNYGSGDFKRALLDVNQPLHGETLLGRIAASTEDSKQYVADDAWFHRQNYYGSVTWKPTSNTVLTTHAEYIKLKNNAQNTANLPFAFKPVVVGTSTSYQAVGMLGRGDYEGYRWLNVNGPFNYNQVIYTQFDANLSQRLTDWLSLRVLGAHWERAQDNYAVQISNSAYNGLPAISGLPAGGFLATTYTDAKGNVYAPGFYSTQRLNPSQNRELQSNGQADLLATFRTAGVEHKLLLTADYINNHARAVTKSSSRADATTPLANFLNGGLRYNATFPYVWDFYNSSVWDSTTTNTRTETITKGFMASERAGFFRNKLLVIVGGRHDTIERGQRNFLGVTSGPTATVPAGAWAQFPNQKATTYQTGVVYKLRPSLSAYANFSSAFQPQSTSTTMVDVNGLPLDPQRGSSKEVGFKASFLDDRLTFTTAAYDIKRTNTPRTARDANGNALNIPGTAAGSTRNYSVVADVESKGVEFDGSWRINDEFQTGFAGAYNKVRYTKVPNVTEQYLLGVAPDNSPKWSASTYVTYRRSEGLLKGGNARLGVRYLGESLASNSTSSIYGDSGVKGAPVTIGGQTFDTYFFKQPAYFVVEGGVGYGWRTKFGRLAHSVNLDVKNALNEKYLKGQRQGDPFSINLSYEIKH